MGICANINILAELAYKKTYRDPGRLGHEHQSQFKGLRTRSNDDVSSELGTGENWVFQLYW